MANMIQRRCGFLYPTLLTTLDLRVELLEWYQFSEGTDFLCR